MKKLLSVIFFLSLALCASAEKITFYTGGALNIAAIDAFESFIPANDALFGSKASVKSISKESGDIWKMSVNVILKENEPVTYDYFLKPGICIYMRSSIRPRVTYSLKVVSVDWNKAVFEVE